MNLARLENDDVEGGIDRYSCCETLLLLTIRDDRADVDIGAEVGRGGMEKSLGGNRGPPPGLECVECE